jgi:hypothetical protein
MNPRQVSILWILAVVLGLAVTFVKVRQQSSTQTATDRSPGEKLFEKFPAGETAAITLTDADSTLTLRKKDGGWVVAEREDFPARTSNVLSLLRTLAEIKIVQAMEAGPSFAPRFGMDESAKEADDRGITAAFADASGKEIARVSIGRTLESGGRFVRNHADETGFYTVNDMLFIFDGDPTRWLDDGFIKPEKITSIHVADADKPDLKLWHVSRETEDGEYQLADAAPGEILDTATATALKSVLGFARFNDVIPAADVEARKADTAKPRIATLTTAEGFTYTLTLTPAKPKAEGDDPAAAPAGDETLLTVTVDATLPAERKKAEGETADAAAELDKAFAERSTTLKTRLEKEKALAGRTFLVSKSTIESLLKSRDEITAAPAEPATTATPPALEGAAIGGLLGAPPAGGVTVTTPPIEIPAIPVEEE